MKNPIGKPLEIQPLQSETLKYGWRIIDRVNQVNYDITEEPWATICAAAYTNAGREPAYGPVEVVYEGANAQNKSFVTNYDEIAANGRVFTTVDDLMAYLYAVDFHGFALTIHFLGEIPDIWLRTDRFVSCATMYLDFAGEIPQKGGSSDVCMNLTPANACVSKCCGVRIYGPVTTHVNGSIILEADSKGMPDLFYTENSYVLFENLNILVKDGVWVADSTISYPAIFLSGMGSKIEFNNRVIIGWNYNSDRPRTDRQWPFYVMMSVNYSYVLFQAECEFTMRNKDKTNVWEFNDKPPFMATRFAMVRMSCKDGGGWLGAFKLTNSQSGVHASVNAYIDTSARMSAILEGCGLKTSKVSTQGQVRFG